MPKFPAPPLALQAVLKGTYVGYLWMDKCLPICVSLKSKILKWTEGSEYRMDAYYICLEKNFSTMKLIQDNCRTLISYK